MVCGTGLEICMWRRDGTGRTDGGGTGRDGDWRLEIGMWRRDGTGLEIGMWRRDGTGRDWR